VIEWYTWIQVGVGVVAGVICLGFGFAGRKPADITMGATALVLLLLIVQLVISIVAPFAGNPPKGDLLEFYMYLISAILLPFAAGFWALLDRTKWSTVILGIVCLAVAVMVYRMNVIWFVQSA
jgi:hypothetical protein